MEGTEFINRTVVEAGNTAGFLLSLHYGSTGTGHHGKDSGLDI